MRPPKPFPPQTAEQLQQLLKTQIRQDERARVQAVLMRAISSAPPEQIASVTGLAINTVRGLHSRFLRDGIKCLVGRPGRGGRRRELIAAKDQRKFVATYSERAQRGQMVCLSDVTQDYEKQFGHALSKSRLYRMFAQEGWRKVMPRSFHPKKEPGSEVTFKKSIGI